MGAAPHGSGKNEGRRVGAAKRARDHGADLRDRGRAVDQRPSAAAAYGSRLSVRPGEEEFGLACVGDGRVRPSRHCKGVGSI